MRVVTVTREEIAVLRGPFRNAMEDVPPRLEAAGALGLLRQESICILGSVTCPDTVAPAVQVAMGCLPDLPVISGFHSPPEQDCLRALLWRMHPVIVCPARSLSSIQRALPWSTALDSGLGLAISSLPEKLRRPTASSAASRNRLAVALCDYILVVYASPEGKLRALCDSLLVRGRRVLTLDLPENEGLVRRGAIPTHPSDVAKQIRRLQLAAPR